MAKTLYLSLHPYVIVKDENSLKCYSDLLNAAKTAKSADPSEIKVCLDTAYELVKTALKKDKPNFFTLGYYLSENPNADLSTYSIAQINELTRQYLDSRFMLDFIATAEKGVAYSNDKSVNAKTEVLPKLKDALAYFKAKDIKESKANEYVKTLSKAVSDSIDRLNVKKNSTEYVFHSAFASSVKEYFDGIKNNPIQEKIYLKNKAKYDAIVAKGTEPDWVLKPQVIVDLDLKIENICKVLEAIIATYENTIENKSQFIAKDRVVEIIDYLKEQASKFTVKMNKSIAKAKAIKLLEEVGIPEPTTRFNQYPFEFSGGMRQRIVIAIALSANPDILICDEPTTALDVTIQAQILELINVIKKERNLSVIFITHNLGVVANMADRIAVMYAGKIVEYGTSEEIFYEPAHPYTWARLTSMPDHETTEKLESIPGTPPNMI